MRYIVIDNVRYEWKKIREIRRAQIQAARVKHPTLFELRDDVRPKSQQTAHGRYSEPTLFDGRKAQ